MTDKREGPELAKQVPWFTCTSCKHFEISMIKSGRTPEFSHRCTHSESPKSNFVFHGNLEGSRTPEWCPFKDMMKTPRQRIYVDMDRVLCDYDKGIETYGKSKGIPTEEKFPQSKLGFFITLEPMPGAIEAMTKLQEKYDVWILSRPSFFNMQCYTEKAVWVRNHLGLDMQKKLILCGDKSLLMGDFLIDDSVKDGQLDFQGKLLRFGSEFPDWTSILKFFEML